MMKSFSIFIILLTFFTPVKSQTEISISLKNSGNIRYDKCYLFRYSGVNRSIVDSAVFDEKLKTRFSIPTPLSKGVYEIRLSGFDMLQVVLSPIPEKIDIEIDVADLKKGKYPHVNEETNALQEYTKIFNDYKFKSLATIKMRTSINRNDSNYINKIKTFIANTNQHKKFAQHKLDSLSKVYPQSYVATTLKSLFPEPLIPANLNNLENDSDIIFVRKHYFDYWAIHDNSLFENPFANERLMNYLSKFSGQSPEQKKNAVDIAMNVFEKNKAAKEKIFVFLLQYFLRYGPAELVTYLYDQYAQGCETDVISKDDLKTINEIRLVSVGEKIPELIASDLSGTTLQLSKIYPINKLTCLIFWASNCSHCQEEIPILRTIYNKYKPKGFEIVAFSLDTDKAAWENAVKSLGLQWYNVSDLKGFKSEYMKTYFIYRTPAMYLVDSQGKILAKDLKESELEKKLSEILK